MNKTLRRAQFGLVDLLRGPNKPVSPIVDIGPECFAAADGSMVCWQGVHYKRCDASLRVRLHNWLIQL